MKVDKERLYKLYMDWVDEVSDNCDWKTSFGPEEIVHAIGAIIENYPDLIDNNDNKK